MNDGATTSSSTPTDNDKAHADMAAALQLKLGDLPNKPPPKAGFSYASMARKAATDDSRAEVERLLEAGSPSAPPADAASGATDASGSS